MEFAIVGGAVSLPGVDDLDRMRSDLHTGNTHFDTVSRAQALAAGLGEHEVDHENYVATASPLDRATCFDREFFRMTAAEALWTDPQHRLLLTLTQEAVESAAVSADTGRVGVYTTIGSPSYLWGRVAPEDQPGPARVDYQSLLGNDRDFVSSRIAYKFGFTGAAMNVQSACSSSLVALHQACLALAFGDIDVAVVGAASLEFPQEHGYIYEQGGILSPTGRSRPFDADADGTLRGSGGGVVILRRLGDAVADQDNILAVVAGSAVNNDGSQKMGYSAPSVQGQQDVLTRAMERAGVAPSDIGYVEAHGTGTAIGDPIEFRALSRAYGDGADRSGPCYLGSAKANYGHLDVAAGMIGLLKAVLVLESETVFPQPGFSEPNPSIGLDKSPFDIATAPVSLPGLSHASVSSFGMGGTNAHVVLRKAPNRARPDSADRVSITVSARSSEGLTSYRRRLAEYLRSRPDLDIRDVAATLDTRTSYENSWTTTAGTVAELADRLDRDGDVPGDVESGQSATVGLEIWLPPAPLLRERHELPFVLASRDTSSPQHGTTGVRETFLRLVSEELGVRVDADTDFFAAGGESMTLVTLVGKLTDLHGFRADFDELDGVTRLGEMSGVLEGQANSRGETRSDLIVYGSGDPDIYLYPPAGGTNFCYAALHRTAPEHTLAAFRAVRSGETVEDIAAECVANMRKADAIRDGMVLGGYSFGGNVAFEIARILENDESVSPRHIVMIDSYAPGSFRGLSDSSGRMASEIEELLRGAAMELTGYDSGTDTDSSGERVLDAFGAVWSANNRALARYRPAGTVRAPITLLRADTRLSDARATALGIDVDRTDDWAEWTSARFDVVDVPGDHYSLFTDPADRSVTAQTFTSVLHAVRTGTGGRTRSEGSE
ncbi:MAG: hypothetical protein GX610_08620 [Rhodococcus sp.]|nr:hypothetical protein [Rhodococcus sp. (in: high G+C Gram-positive bacteria)]